MQDGTSGLGHNNPPASAGAPWLDGRRALIRRRGRSVGASGRARAERWVLTFEREAPAEIEPLMGWTGGTGPLTTEVALTFPTRAQAVAYAERQGLAYRIAPDPAGRVRPNALRVWRSNRDATPMQVRATAQDRSVDDPVPAGLPIWSGPWSTRPRSSPRRPPCSITPGCCRAASGRSCGAGAGTSI